MDRPIIGGLNEKSLHRSLKMLYMTPEALEETKVDGYVIDVVTPARLFEIQTGGFSGIRTKLSKLLANHPLTLVHPVAAETFISVYTEAGELRSRRRSPKRCSFRTAASELLYIAELLPHPNLIVDILIVRQEEIRIDDGKGSWRRKGLSINDRKLLYVIEQRSFDKAVDYLKFLPDGLPEPFGNRELAEALESTGTGRRGRLKLAGQLTYLLRKLNLISGEGRDGNRLLFSLNR